MATVDECLKQLHVEWLENLLEEMRRLEEERRRLKAELVKRLFGPGKHSKRMVDEYVKRRSANGGSGYSYSSSGSSGGAPGGHCGTNGAGGGSNHDGSSWSSGGRTRPGGTGTADGGSSGCSCGSSRSSGKKRGTDGAGGGSEETPNGHSGSSGNSGFPGSPGSLRDTPDGTGRPDGLLAHGYATMECVGAGQQNCIVTLEVGRRDNFDSASMVSGDGSIWKEVLLWKDDEGRPLVKEVRLMLFGRERCCWEVDHDTPFVQVIDLKSVDQGRTASISWKLGNKEPGRMTDLQCDVEMSCQHRRGQDGATETTERTTFPLRLQARDFSSPNAPVGNNDDSPVYRGGILSVGEHEHIVTHLLDIVAQHKTLQDETALRLSRLELRDTKREDEISQIRQQKEMDNRRIADLEKFKEKFSQVQPSSDD